MRVLITADAVGGVWTYALDLARGLAPHGVETLLAVTGPSPTPDQRRTAASIPSLTLIDTGLPLDWLAETAQEVARAGDAVMRLAATHGADLIHLNTPALGARFSPHPNPSPKGEGLYLRSFSPSRASPSPVLPAEPIELSTNPERIISQNSTIPGTAASVVSR